MANPVLMPQAGISVESCIITEWLKQPGDPVAVGDILFSYETDKAAFECESTEAGTLLERFFGQGDEVPVLTAVCAVGDPGEDVSALRPGAAGGSEPAARVEPATAAAVVATAPPADSAAPAAPAPTGGDIELKASPRAKNLAARQHIDLGLAEPTGPYGRVIERDVRSLMERGVGATAAAFPEAGGIPAGSGIGGRVRMDDLAENAKPDAPGTDYEDIPFTGIRKAISRSMTQSLTTIPQLTHNFSFDATALMGYRKMIKAGGEALGLPNITLGDMVLYAVSRLLPKYPDLNAHMLEGAAIRRFRDVHLGFACDTARGLMVPVIRCANRKSLAQISMEVKELAAAAQTGSISPDCLSGGTFTVSNLGAFGVESFTPVINPPQTGILGVDTIVQRPREADGRISLYPAMGLSLTYDHRAVDGAPASRFVQELCGTLERFTALLAL